MVDFHSHFLPGIDDGSDSIETSLDMLEESYRQGVDLMFATPHFYADEDDPEDFLLRRNHSYEQLRQAMEEYGKELPKICLGAEILYFPGMSVADELVGLIIEQTPFLLVEPPMIPWRESMLDEIELTGENLRCIPVIAHIDRYMRMLRDNTLFERLENRRILTQVNTSFFILSGSSQLALDYLRKKRIHFIGSDCHNMDERPPNMGRAAEIIRLDGADAYFQDINDRVYHLLRHM
jgi:Capsular polysaccharide biosynthesis protein